MGTVESGEGIERLDSIADNRMRSIECGIR